MGITTKTGDDGKSRWMGKTFDKDSELLEVIGTIDELRAVVEMVEERGEFGEIKDDLWQIMGELSCNQKFGECEERVKWLEEEIEKLEQGLVRANKFLSFYSKQAKDLNWARAVARRAERRVVKLSKSQKVNPKILVYFNRLSDYLFVCGRKAEES